MLSWLKEHFEMLSVGALGVFGFGRIVFTQESHSRRINDIENRELVIDEKLDKALQMLERIDERTKRL
jgi:hypothetical protein